MTLFEMFGHVDIYLFDQLLRGNVGPGMRVLDAGCGSGRNLVYLLRAGCEIFAVDANEQAVAEVQGLAAELAPGLPRENIRVAAIEAMPFPDGFVDVVICNSVLHFAQDDQHFGAMVAELARVLRPGGLLFVRLGSTIGMNFLRVAGRRFLLPGDVVWYLVDEELLMRMTAEVGELVDPLKTTVVQGSRCMTTWVLRKRVP